MLIVLLLLTTIGHLLYFKQAMETASIIVVATHDPVEYNCMVTDINGESGYSSVNICSNGELNHIGYINTVYVVEYTW